MTPSITSRLRWRPPSRHHCCRYTVSASHGEIGQQTPKNDLSVFIVEQAATSADKKNGMLALEPDVKAPLQSVTQDIKINLGTPSLAAFFMSRARNFFSQTTARELCKAEGKFTASRKEVLVRRAHIDGDIQKLVPQSLRQQFPALSTCLSLYGSLEQRLIFDKMWKDYLWTIMAFDVHDNVNSCKSCTENRGGAKHRRHLHLLLETNQLEFVAINILRLLPETTKKNQHVLITKDRYSKLTRAFSTAWTTTNTVTYISFSAWNIPYGTLVYL